LYAVLAGPIRARLSRVVRSEEIEDRLHEVMVIVLEAIRCGELQAPERLPGFVRTVTRRRIVAHIRSQVFQRQWLVDGVEMVASHDESPEDCAVRQERIERLTRVLRRLKKRDREILERFYLREQNAQQICAEMRLTETQFRLFKSRAIARCVSLVQPLAKPRPIRVTSPDPS
jgi:RNA polymerase sigma factor (sigma-70 family)